jgi:hypothetical protein
LSEDSGSADGTRQCASSAIAHLAAALVAQESNFTTMQCRGGAAAMRERGSHRCLEARCAGQRARFREGPQPSKGQRVERAAGTELSLRRAVQGARKMPGILRRALAWGAAVRQRRSFTSMGSH